MIDWVRELERAAFVGHYSTVWPLIIAPTFAGAMLHFAIPFIDRIDPGSGTQRTMAFTAAVLPGIVFWCIVSFSPGLMPLRRMRSFACIIHCALQVALISFVLIRACVQTSREAVYLRRLLSLRQAPSWRLQAVATELGLRAWEIPTSNLLCCVAGFFRPSLLISRGALILLDDEELRAALLHEKAHLTHRENMWTSIAAFLGRNSLFQTSASLNCFSKTGDYAADREAIRNADPLILATALLRFSSCAVQPKSMASNFANQQDISLRVRFLLGEHGRADVTFDTFAAVVLLVAAAALAFVPAAMRVANAILCRRVV